MHGHEYSISCVLRCAWPHKHILKICGAIQSITRYLFFNDVQDHTFGMQKTTCVQDEAGTPLGTLTAMETSTGSKFVCVCYVHRCRRVVSAGPSADIELLADWLLKGKGLPESRHVELLDEMLVSRHAPDVAVAAPCPPVPEPALVDRGPQGSRLFCMFGPFKINELVVRAVGQDSRWCVRGTWIGRARGTSAQAIVTSASRHCLNRISFGV